MFLLQLMLRELKQMDLFFFAEIRKNPKTNEM
jgi:hypothetical protein